MVETAKRYVRYSDLVAEGVITNRMDVARKVAAGFPAPLELGPNTICWDRAEIDAWLALRPRRYPKVGGKHPTIVGEETASIAE